MDYRDIALKMAIRHPRVGEILSNIVTEKEEIELAMEYGLIYKRPLDFKDWGHYQFKPTAKMSELINLYPVILQKDYRFTIGFDTTILFASNDKSMPTKLTLSDQNKEGLMIKNINFDWYDHIIIHGKSAYSLDPTQKINKQIKRNNNILNDYILNKRWFELLPL